MTPAKAFSVLGLNDTATQHEVRVKWKQLCMVHHPDRGGDPVKFDEIHRSYTIAFGEAGKLKECKECHGTGKLRQTYGFNSIDMPCAFCGGSGHKEVTS